MNISYPLILASASPARFQVLNSIGIPCLQFPSHADEETPEKDPLKHTLLIAQRKMESFSAQYRASAAHPVITADTVVSIHSMILGKPEDRDQAREYLSLLSGSTHQIITGFCIRLPYCDQVLTGNDTTHVRFHEISEKEIQDYLDTEEWKLAAGAYRIQQRGALLIDSIIGSFWNVVGLPIEKIFGIVRKQDCLHVVTGP